MYRDLLLPFLQHIPHKHNNYTMNQSYQYECVCIPVYIEYVWWLNLFDGTNAV